MNYAYDILLNWNKNLYDFYEWNVEDEITHIRKIPLFRVNKDVIRDFIENVVILSSSFLERINKKADMFTSRGIKQLEYACILSDGDNTVAIKFDKNGKSILKSRLLIDEDIEISEIAYNISEIIIDYEKCYKLKLNPMTRKEQKIKRYIDKEINKLGENDTEKLKYLYFDLFAEKENDISKILEKITSSLNNNWSKYYESVYNFFKILSVNK